MKKSIFYGIAFSLTLIVLTASARFATCVHCRGDARPPAREDQAFNPAVCWGGCDQCVSGMQPALDRNKNQICE